MLAALDDDSEDESVGNSARANLISKFTKRGTSKSPGPQRVESPTKSASNKDSAEPDKDSEDEEDEEEIVRPKGRMAARMQVAGESSEEEVQPENARERVKKLLLAKSKSPEPSTNNEGSDGSAESDVPVVSRKRKIRTTRQETPKSSKPKAAASPGLFVSPSRPKSAGSGSNASDSDELPVLGDDKFKALVERKRKELQEKQKEAAAEKAKKLAERKRHAQILEEDELELSDEDGRRRLTQPIRKAGKKAQEEIRRETQRMSRNQQLAHNATTKKKFSKKDFFARMNYRQDGKADAETARPTSSSSAAPHSDVEMKDTPPTSPSSPNLEKPIRVASLPPAIIEAEENDDDLPTLEDALTRLPSSPPVKLDKGKGRAIEEPTQESKPQQKKSMFTRPKIRQPKMAGKQSIMAADSDSDLEIVSVKTPNARNKKLDSIFNRIPEKQAKESHSLHALRMLAHLTSPGKKNFGKNRKPGMTTSELQVSLQQRARQQATREREERLQALRDKGVIVQTAEEREKENAEVEDLVERARQEGEEIQKREKAAAKKERKEKGEVDPLGDDSSDDEDWEEEKGKTGKVGSDSGSDGEEIEFSGSEEGDAGGEEEDEMDMDGDEASESKISNPLFDNEASDTEDDEAEPDPFIDEEMAEDGDIDEDEEQQLPVKQKRRRNRNTNVISDDESEDGDAKNITPAAPRTDSPMQQKKSPAAPNSVLRSATKTFIPGLTVTGPVGLGLTQIFAGTMDESQEPPFTEPNGDSQQMETQDDSMAFLKRFNAPELPPFVPTMSEDTQTQDQGVIMDSQPILPESQAMDLESQQIQLQFSQSQMHDFGTLAESTQMSPFPATQDVGFQHMTPIRGRFVDAPPSTVETVILDPTAVPETMDETPIAKKKGKLRRRAPAVAFSDEEDLVEPQEKVVEDEDFEITADAFDVMRKASKKKPIVVDEFDKKNSKAKEMVNEQAEESEDEYAGLGGASDDESGGEEDALIKAMVDDEGGEKVDERKLAAFFA